MNATRNIAALVLSLAGAAAQANVVTTTNGNTTNYLENFNGGSSFSAGYFNAPLTPDDYLMLGNGIFGQSHASSFSFTTTAPLSTVLLSFYYSVAGRNNATVSFAGSTETLSNTPWGIIAFAGNNPGAATNGPFDKYDALFSETWSNLAAGTYTLTFATTRGPLHGVKVDDVSINVTAVPEPETYAMMLAGLGLLGVMVRRRLPRKPTA